MIFAPLLFPRPCPFWSALRGAVRLLLLLVDQQAQLFGRAKFDSAPFRSELTTDIHIDTAEAENFDLTSVPLWSPTSASSTESSTSTPQSPVQFEPENTIVNPVVSSETEASEDPALADRPRPNPVQPLLDQEHQLDDCLLSSDLDPRSPTGPAHSSEPPQTVPEVFPESQADLLAGELAVESCEEPTASADDEAADPSEAVSESAAQEASCSALIIEDSPISSTSDPVLSESPAHSSSSAPSPPSPAPSDSAYLSDEGFFAEEEDQDRWLAWSWARPARPDSRSSSAESSLDFFCEAQLAPWPALPSLHPPRDCTLYYRLTFVE